MKYTNSALVGYRKISPNRTSPRNHTIDRITPHCYVGQASAKSMANWLCNPSAQASCNYGIAADGTVALIVEEQDRSWCSSSSANDNRAITIECASDAIEPYKINDTVYHKLLDLMTDICIRNGKKKLLWFGDKEKSLSYNPAPDEMIITVHRWFAAKECPGQYIMDQLGAIADTVSRRLGSETPQEAAKTIYRVRLVWEYQTTQKGAFYSLESAKQCCDEYPGFSVYDDNGKVVYTSPDKSVYTPSEWINMVAPIAMDLAMKYAVLPSVVIAQTALETGWGLTDLTRRYNIVGMKADLINSTWEKYSTWDGTTYMKVTPEYVNGNLIHKEDVFRVYKTFRECLEDYVNFLLHVKNYKGYKYRRLQRLTDPKQVINVIKVGTGTNSDPEGYSTDPAYEGKILDLIEKYNLKQFDTVMLSQTEDHGEATQPSNGHVHYRVQVGAYSNKKYANNCASEVKKKSGFDCFIEKTDWYRVYCGSFENKTNAKQRTKDLQKAGITNYVIKEIH